MRVVRDNANPQLPLPLALADHARFANYLAGPNHEIIASLTDLSSDYGNAQWLWGASGSGKSHLLQAVCAAHENAAYLPTSELLDPGPAVLAGFERFAVVCIDDVQALLGQRLWEEPLFALYNALADQIGIMLVAGQDNPKLLTFALPDLKTRLRSGTVHQLQALDDEQSIAALRLRANLRGLELPRSTGRYLLTHYRRDMRSLCTLLDELDSASLAARRRLTVPFVKSVIFR